MRLNLKHFNERAETMKIDRSGVTRIVILIWKYAIKIPNFTYSYQHFLWGLLGNINEVSTFKNKVTRNRVCPILFHLPLGLMVIMRRVKILTDEEFLSHRDELEEILKVQEDWVITTELKSNSFGWYNGKIVVTDYGS